MTMSGEMRSYRHRPVANSFLVEFAVTALWAMTGMRSTSLILALGFGGKFQQALALLFG
jgi:hypothetical protein